MVKAALNRMEHKRGELSSGFPQLDEVLGGLEKRKVYLLAGNPGNGVHEMLLSMARQLAEAGKKVVWFSPNQIAEEVAREVLEQYPGENAEKASRVLKLPFLVHDKLCPCITGLLDSLVTKNEYLSADAVFIDGLEFLYKEDSFLDRRQELEAIFRDVKEAAGFLDFPIFVSCMLTEEVDQRPDPRPQLTDLRHLGMIRHYADGILLLYREENYVPNTENKSLLEIYVKGKKGARLQRVPMLYLAEYGRCDAVSDVAAV